MKKPWLKLIIFIAAAVAVLVLGIYALLQTPAATQWIFNKARNYLRSSADIDLNASRMKLDPLKAAVVLENVVLRSVSAPDMPPFFTASRVAVRPRIFGMIRGMVDIKYLSVSSPRISYIVQQDGRTNLPRIKKSSKPAPKYCIGYAELDNGSFLYNDFHTNIYTYIPEFRLRVNGDRRTLDHDVDLVTQRMAFVRYQEDQIPLSFLSILGTFGQNKFDLAMLQLRTRASRLTAKGTLENFSAPELHLQFEHALNLNEIAGYLKSEQPLRGAVTGTLRADGTLQDLNLSTQAKGVDFSAGPIQNTSFEFQGNARLNPGQIFVNKFTVTSPQGMVDGNAVVSTDTGSGKNTIRAALRDFDLYPVWRLIKPPFDLASRGSGQFSLSWTGPFKISTIAANAHLNLQATRKTPAHDILPFTGDLIAEMQSGHMAGTLQSAAVMGARINGRFSLHSFKTIDATIEGKIGDIAPTLSDVSRFIADPDPTLVGIKMYGPVQFRSQIEGSLNNPKIETKLESPILRVGNLTDLKLKADATIHKSQVPFQASIELPDRSAIMSQGTLDFSGRKAVLHLDASTDHIPTESALRLLGSSIPAAGDLNANIHLDGPVDNLSGNALVGGENIVLYKEPLGRFTAELRLTGNEIHSNQIRFIRDSQNPDTNYMDASFSYGLRSEQFEFSVNGKELKWEQRQLPGGNIVGGTLNLAASGHGTFDRPSIDVSMESTALLVRQRPIGPVSITATMRDDRATITAVAPQISLTSTTHITARSPYPFEQELQINDSDLSVLGLTAANKQPLTGSISAKAVGSGNLEDLSTARASAQIDKLELRAGNLEARTEGTLEAEYRDKSLSISRPATVISGNSRIEIAGNVPLDQTGTSGAVTLRGQLDLAQAEALLPLPQGLAIAGIMNLDLSVTGTMHALHTAGSITMDNGTVRIPRVSVPISNILIRANLENGTLLLQRTEAMLGDGFISLKGEFPFGLLPENIPLKLFRKNGPARLELDLDNFRPETAGLLPPGFQGRISLHASGQAGSTDLRAINGEIIFRQLQFNANEISLEQKEQSTILIRNGIATVSKLALIGTETSIEATGSAGLTPDGLLNLTLRGNFDAALLTVNEKDLKTTGRIQVQVALDGTRKSPSLSGTADMTGGRFTLRNPRVIADSLTAHLNLAPNLITVSEFKSTLNGGTLSITGTIGYQRGSLNNFNLKATIQDVFLNFPDGLRSSSSGNLTVTSSDENIVIGGTIRVPESSYRESFTVTGPLMSYLKTDRAVVVGGAEPNPLLARVRLNIGLRTTSPLFVQNNIARLEATANLRIVGSFYQPSLVGRVTLEQGGEIVMNNRVYYIERGTVTLNDQSQVRPELDIEAQTRVDQYDITLRLTGRPERLSTALTSEPSLPEQDILSLLLTGKVSSESTQQVARAQALALIAGQAGEEVTREARQALRLSTFRIDPGGLIASESDLGARLTIGEDITRNFSLAYSMNLVDGGEQIWAAQYRITRRLTTQATKQENNTYRFEFRHDLRLGGAPATRTTTRTAPTRFTIGAIRFEGERSASKQQLLDRFNVKPGDKYSFPKVQKGLDRLHEFYAGQKRLESNIRLQRETDEKEVTLDVNINPGPTVEFDYSGMQLPEKVREEVEKAWRDGVFDVERIENAVATIRRSLLRDGYLQAQITNRIENFEDRKIVHFQITAGTKYTNVLTRFPGASAIKEDELRTALERADLELDAIANPQKVIDYLRQYYRDRGFLQAKIDLPLRNLNANNGTGEIAIPVHEGPMFIVGELEFSGNRAFSYDQLWAVIPTSSGSIYNPKSMQDAIKALENLYHQKGFNEVSIGYQIIQNPPKARADITFQINERRQSIIGTINIEGTEGTSQEFVQRQLDFQAGDVLDLDKIDETRRRLYATGVYSSIDFQNEEIPGPTLTPGIKNIQVRVRLREIRPYRLQYGFFFDTDRGPGGIFEAQNLNFLGRASTLGLKLRYDSNLKEARIYFNQPFVTRNFLKMDATAFIQKEDRTAFSANRIGFSLFRQVNLKRKYVLDYGYRYDHVRWNGLPKDPTIFQAEVPVARAIATITRDTRDSILDATRGEFTSHSIEFGPRFLGSEIGFTRYFGQYFRYVPLDKYLGKPVKDSEGNRLPASLVYASALRLGLTSAFGGAKILSPERFFAGGGTTMRGFKQDMLGPTETITDPETGEPVERPIGGEALFLFNNEIRFPIFSVFQGVGFVDIGNVYPRISDFNFHLRKSAGIGLRIKIKFIPIRFDYGFILDRKKPEDRNRGAFFFSIGQAF